MDYTNGTGLITAGQNTTSLTVTAGAAGQNGSISVTAGNSCGTSSGSQTINITPVQEITPGIQRQ